jgi:sec-independent protein translocase protein TatA
MDSLCIASIFNGIGLPELIIILVIVLFLFGAKKLPDLARSLGKSVNEFKKGMNDKDEKTTDSDASKQDSSSEKKDDSGNKPAKS